MAWEEYGADGRGARGTQKGARCWLADTSHDHWRWVRQRQGDRDQGGAMAALATNPWSVANSRGIPGARCFLRAAAVFDNLICSIT
jgi:hypothetical protein